MAPFILFLTRRWALTCWLLVSTIAPLWATHIRAGEITSRRLDSDPTGLTYEFTLTVYTDDDSNVQDEIINLNMGYQNPEDVILEVARQSRTTVEDLPQTSRNKYVVVHTFPSPGRYYRISYEERFRNTSLINVAQPNLQEFYVETEIFISAALSANTSPTPTNEPVGKANVGEVYLHNPGAFDENTETDSIAYVPQGEGTFTPFVPFKGPNTPVDGYRLPNDPSFGGQAGTTCGGLGAGPSSFRIYNQNDPEVVAGTYEAGDVVWDTPGTPGEFNFAFRIEEYRRLPEGDPDGEYVLIGYIVRDMQVFVLDYDNCPPEITPLDLVCVVAGDTLLQEVVATDPDNDPVTLEAVGEAFEGVTPLERPVFEALPLQSPVAAGQLTWATNCLHVRSAPYRFLFTAADRDPGSLQSLSTSEELSVQVVGPSPTGLSVAPQAGGINVVWDEYACADQAESMTLYRRQGLGALPIDTCNPGVDPASGYVPIAELPIGTTSYRDDDVAPGAFYSYALAALFSPATEYYSLPSDTAVTQLPLEFPVPVEASVVTTDTVNGRVAVSWVRPPEVDTQSFPPPYEYRLERTVTGGLAPFAEVYRVGGTLTDTLFNYEDTLLNTRDAGYNYRVQFYSVLGGEDTLSLRGSSPEATTVRLSAEGGIDQVRLTWTARVPWDNSNRVHLVYRQAPGEPALALYDSLRVGNGTAFTYLDDDPDLLAGEAYCYYVITEGSFLGIDSILPEPVVNLSQVACAVPVDTTAPCPPALTLEPSTDCPECVPGQKTIIAQTFANTLTWTYPVEINGIPCDTTVARFNIYFMPFEDDSVGTLLASVAGDVFTFLHDGLTTPLGCYAVTSVDRFGNESERSNRVCRPAEESCFEFELPNVFTPDNDDATNPFFEARCLSPAFIESVEVLIVDRWGKEIHAATFDNEAAPPDGVYWNGRTPSGELAPAGVYYYYIALRVRGLARETERRTFKGWVQLLR